MQDSKVQAVRKRVALNGGDPKSVIFSVCCHCPPEKIAEFEQKRLKPELGVGYLDY